MYQYLEIDSVPIIISHKSNDVIIDDNLKENLLNTISKQGETSGILSINGNNIQWNLFMKGYAIQFNKETNYYEIHHPLIGCVDKFDLLTEALLYTFN